MTEPRVLPLRAATYHRAGLAAIVFIDLVAVGLAFVADGVGQWVMTAIAAVMVLGTVPLVRALGRRAIILDGTRIGWRNGIVGPGSWTEVEDVVLVSRNRIGTRRRPVFNLVLWARAGGMGPVTGLLARVGLTPADRDRLRSASEARLRPFVVPLTDLGPEGAAEVEAWLGRR